MHSIWVIAETLLISRLYGMSVDSYFHIKAKTHLQHHFEILNFARASTDYRCICLIPLWKEWVALWIGQWFAAVVYFCTHTSFDSLRKYFQIYHMHAFRNLKKMLCKTWYLNCRHQWIFTISACYRAIFGNILHGCKLFRKLGELVEKDNDRNLPVKQATWCK